jgi:PKHD-type hydroxylase
MVRQNWRIWRAGADIGLLTERTKDLKLDRASTFGGDTDTHRKSNVAWLHEVDNATLFHLFKFAKDFADVTSIEIMCRADIQYTEYHGSEGGKYDWHHDIDWNRNDGWDRKISVTVQMSHPDEYEGGDFAMGDGQEPLPDWHKEKGTVLLFPSYIVHRVAPVTSGVRKSLVAWFEGPTWR